MKLLSVFKTPYIEFFCDERYYGVAPEPQPAVKFVPEWFKKIPPYSKTTRDARGKPSMNAKKCLPLLDAMSVGFIIPMAIDQQIASNHDCSRINLGPTSTVFDPAAQFHSVEQVGGKSSLFPGDAVKFINPWVVKTAPGWSTLFVPPVNHFDDRFICLGGLVDTDRFPKQVNFPARWLKPDYDGVVAAGTPLVTAIPIQRSSMAMRHNVRRMTEQEAQEIDRIRRCQESRDHYYTHELREPR